MCISQVQNHHGKKVHVIKKSESENDMFILTVNVEYKKYIRLMESAETESELEKWT